MKKIDINMFQALFTMLNHSYNMDDTSLFTIISSKRHLLDDFLVKHGAYDKLANKILDAYELWKTTAGDNMPFLKSFMLGRIGYRCYERQLICELPTHELVYTILHLMNMFSITTCYEFNAQTDILSSVLDKITKKRVADHLSSRITYFLCRDRSCIADFRYNTAVEQLEQTFYGTLLRGATSIAINSCVIINWINVRSTIHVIDFLSLVNPQLLCVIHDKTHEQNVTEGFSADYVKLSFNLKQICYRDDIHSLKISSHSMLTVFISKSAIPATSITVQTITKSNFLTSLKTKYFDICGFEEMELPRIPMNDQIIDELVSNYKCPTIIKDLSESELLTLLNSYSAASIKIKIPLFIKTTNELMFWGTLFKQKLDPQNITSYEKFKEYLKLIVKTYSADGINELQSCGIISAWANTRQLAKMFLFLEYSTDQDNKMWRFNQREAKHCYDEINKYRDYS